jgi:putative tryptophan/tyrosine transport system substrate-binding protein
MRRREFIAGLGGTVVSWPLKVRAQQSGRVRQIGILHPGDENGPTVKVYLPLFTQRLEELGWVNGRNYASIFVSLAEMSTGCALSHGSYPT